MFFKLHKDAKIGFKVLSAADLGNSDGHTTAIGLWEPLKTTKKAA